MLRRPLLQVRLLPPQLPRPLPRLNTTSRVRRHPRVRMLLYAKVNLTETVGQGDGKGNHGDLTAVFLFYFISENMTEIFIKNVSKVTQEQLKEVFTAEFGEVKSVNLVQAKNCAFLEFVSPESCQKALAQNKVQVGEVTVSAEERRPPGSRYPRPQNGFDRKFQSNRRGGGSMRGKPRNPPNPPK